LLLGRMQSPHSGLNSEGNFPSSPKKKTREAYLTSPVHIGQEWHVPWDRQRAKLQ
jgi:hypothetical protein